MDARLPNSDTDARGPRGPRWHYLIVLLAGAVTLLPALGDTPLESHEAHVALVAKTLLGQAGWLRDDLLPEPAPPHSRLNHWILPVENQQPRLNKTPLMYWCAAAVAWVGGLSTTTVRIPSAVAAILLGVVTLGLGRRMMPPRAALLGALFIVSCLGVVKMGRLARPEMLLAVLATAAMACFYLGLEAPTAARRTAWMAAFWLTMGLANVAKEFVPVLLLWPAAAYALWHGRREDTHPIRPLAEFFIASGVLVTAYSMTAGAPWILEHQSLSRALMALTFLLPLVWLAIRCRPWRALLRLLPTAIPGLAVMFLMFVPWLLHMRNLLPETAARVFTNELTDRFNPGGRWSFQSPHVPLLSAFQLTAPWCALLPAALVAVWLPRFQQYRKPLVFLLLWGVGMTLLLTAVAVKRWHYLLPGVCPLALLMGFLMSDSLSETSWIPRAVTRVSGIAVGAVAPVALVVLVVLAAKDRWSARWTDLVWTAAAAQLPWLAAGFLAWRSRLWPSTLCLVAAFVVMGAGISMASYHWNGDLGNSLFAEQAARTVPPGQEVWSWEAIDTDVIYHFGRDIPSLQWRKGALLARAPGGDEALAQKRFDEWLAGPEGPRWIVAHEFQGPQVTRLGYVQVLASQPVRDKGYACRLFRKP